MVQNPTPKEETALLPLLRRDCSRGISDGSTDAIKINLTSWKSVWAWSDARAEARPRSRKFASQGRGLHQRTLRQARTKSQTPEPYTFLRAHEVLSAAQGRTPTS